MQQPPGYESSDPTLVCKLLKAIYGLKEAPRAWNEKVFDFLMSIGFKSLESDHGNFVMNDGTCRAFILVYVHIFVIMAQHLDMIVQIKNQLSLEFEMKAMGEIGHFLRLNTSGN